MRLQYIQSRYYSGQGIVYAGVRQSGAIKRLVPLGNVTALRCTNQSAYHEPLWSENGLLVPGTPELISHDGEFAATLESVSNANLAWVLGQELSAATRAEAGAGEIAGYVGKGVYLGRTAGALADVMLVGASTSLVAYTDAFTDWDYRYDNETGLLEINDGIALPFAEFAADTDVYVAVVSITARGDGIADMVVADASSAIVGARVTLNAPSMLGGTTYVCDVLSVLGDTVTIAIPEDLDTVLIAWAIFDGFAISYTALVGTPVEGVGLRIEEPPESFLRFVGLNMAASGENFVVDIPRAKVRIDGGFGVINDGVADLKILGRMLPVVGKFGRDVYYEERTSPQFPYGVIDLGGTNQGWNPADKGTGAALSNGNKSLLSAGGGGYARSARAVSGQSEGLLYFEVAVNASYTSASAADYFVGIADAVMDLEDRALYTDAANPGGNFLSLRFNRQWSSQDAFIGFGGSLATAMATATANGAHVIGVVIEFATRTASFYCDNVHCLSAVWGVGGSGTMYPMASNENESVHITLRLTAAEFTYPPPGAAVAWES